jgi:hypothetical protein
LTTSPVGERARLTAALADAFLRAVGVDLLDKRLEALQAVLLGRKGPPTGARERDHRRNGNGRP